MLLQELQHLRPDEGEEGRDLEGVENKSGSMAAAKDEVERPVVMVNEGAEGGAREERLRRRVVEDKQGASKRGLAAYGIDASKLSAGLKVEEQPGGADLLAETILDRRVAMQIDAMMGNQEIARGGGDGGDAGGARGGGDGAGRGDGRVG